MKTLRFVTFIYSIYLYCTVYTGAAPIISINKQNILNRFNNEQQQQHKNKYMNIRIQNTQNDKLFGGKKQNEQPHKHEGEKDNQFKNIPTYMLDLYRIVSKQTDSDLLNNGNTVRSYFDSESNEAELNFQRYKFEMNDFKAEKEEFKKAELRIFKLSNVYQYSKNIYVQINVVNRLNGKIVSSKIMGTKAHGWMTFPLTDIVKTWLSNPALNKGIRIETKTIHEEGSYLDTVHFATKSHIRREPILVVFTKHKNGGLESLLEMNTIKTEIKNKKMLHRRKRRNTEIRMGNDDTFLNNDSPSLNNDRSKKDDASCRLEPLEVPISLIKAKDQIILPKVLKINQCVGSCKATINGKALINNNHNKDGTISMTNHAVIQAFYSLAHDDAKLPCCAPSSFESETTIQREYKNGRETIKIMVLDSLKATSCSCL